MKAKTFDIEARQFSFWSLYTLGEERSFGVFARGIYTFERALAEYIETQGRSPSTEKDEGGAKVPPSLQYFLPNVF